jgi:multidrug efflux pump subunit AcrA (membrane-fusion protein)
VLLPGGGQARGQVTQVGTVASEASNSGDEGKGTPSDESGESATIPVTIALDHAVAHLDEAPVSVELVKSIRRAVLTVPATALIATAGGGYAVEALADGRRVTVPVTPGMFANGYVQVEGAGVREGMTVIESQ